MKLSVIIPVYNVAPYLRACLDSVCAAGSRELMEIICVDDGSTDESSQILDAYANQPDSFIRVIRQENHGVSAARNRGLDVAKGEWISFVDADDTVDQNWFVRLLSATTDEFDLIHVDANFCFHGRVSSADSCSYRTFLREGWGFLNCVRRSVIGSLRFPEGMRFKEDVVFFTALTCRLNPLRMKCVREKGYHYLRREGSACVSVIHDEDCLRFIAEIKRLNIPREDAARTIGFDLVLWVKGRDWSNGYNPETCPLLAYWRTEIRKGNLRYTDLRWWWRPGLWHWLKTGDLSWLARTRDWRIWLEGLVRGSK